MLYTLTSLLMPILLVFGVYHVMTWFNVAGMNQRPHWRRVAMASLASHLLLVSGFLVFFYIDYRQNTRIAMEVDFETYIFNGIPFWQILMIFDTLPAFVLLALFYAFDKVSVSPGSLLPATMAIVYVFGSLQWYFVGGGLGAVLERFWSGLKTGDEEDEDWL
jgi:hypothetical protein